jgi:hypothetical protein
MTHGTNQPSEALVAEAGKCPPLPPLLLSPVQVLGLIASIDASEITFLKEITAAVRDELLELLGEPLRSRMNEIRTLVRDLKAATRPGMAQFYARSAN